MNLPVQASDHVDWITAVWPGLRLGVGRGEQLAATGPFGSATT